MGGDREGMLYITPWHEQGMTDEQNIRYVHLNNRTVSHVCNLLAEQFTVWQEQSDPYSLFQKILPVPFVAKYQAFPGTVKMLLGGSKYKTGV